MTRQEAYYSMSNDGSNTPYRPEGNPARTIVCGQTNRQPTYRVTQVFFKFHLPGYYYVIIKHFTANFTKSSSCAEILLQSSLKTKENITEHNTCMFIVYLVVFTVGRTEVCSGNTAIVCIALLPVIPETLNTFFQGM